MMTWDEMVASNFEGMSDEDLEALADEMLLSQMREEGC